MKNVKFRGQKKRIPQLNSAAQIPRKKTQKFREIPRTAETVGPTDNWRLVTWTRDVARLLVDDVIFFALLGEFLSSGVEPRALFCRSLLRPSASTAPTAEEFLTTRTVLSVCRTPLLAETPVDARTSPLSGTPRVPPTPPPEVDCLRVLAYSATPMRPYRMQAVSSGTA